MSRVTHLLNSTLDVYRRTEVSDGQGGTTYTYSLLASARKVRLVQASAREQFEAERSGSSLTHKVYQNHDEDIQRGDEYRSGTNHYRVMNVLEPSTPGTYMRADVEILQNEQE
jgi:hypothetical protein